MIYVLLLQLVYLSPVVVAIVGVGGGGGRHRGISGVNDRHVNRGQLEVSPLGQELVHIHATIIWKQAQH